MTKTVSGCRRASSRRAPAAGSSCRSGCSAGRGRRSHPPGGPLRSARGPGRSPLLPEGKLLHGQSGQLGRGGVVGIGGDGDHGAPLSEDPRQEIEELRLAVSHEDLIRRDAEALRRRPGRDPCSPGRGSGRGELTRALISGRSHSGGPRGLMFAEKSRISPAGLPAAAASFVMFPPCRSVMRTPPWSIAAATRAGTSSVQFAGGPERVAGEAADPAEAVGRKEEGGEEGRIPRRSAPAGAPRGTRGEENTQAPRGRGPASGSGGRSRRGPPPGGRRGGGPCGRGGRSGRRAASSGGPTSARGRRPRR